MKILLALLVSIAPLAALAHADPPSAVCRDLGKLELLAGDAPFVEDQRAVLSSAVAAECERERWSEPLRTCFLAARDAAAAWSCVDQLSIAARDPLEAAIVRAVPPSIELASGKLAIRGRLAWAGDRLASDSEPAVDRIAKLLGNKPGLRVEIHVHGDTSLDAKRTQARGDALKHLLLDRLKLTADRITATGHGATQPLGSNATAQGRAHNRRVEIAYTTMSEDDRPHADAVPNGDVRPPTARDLVGYVAALPGRGNKLRATIETSQGTLTCELLPTKAPMTVANFVGLATGQKVFSDLRTGVAVKRRYYDNLTFHRVIPGFMVQGGDPLGTGIGGPGYKFADEIHDANRVEAGSLVMANAGPNTNGAQFFIAEDRVSRLDAGYTVFGRCKQLDVVKKIANVPRGPNDKPTTPVVIRKIDITRVP